MSASRFQFRVLQGSHSEFGRTYGRGDVVNSHSDLRKHNKPGSQKFQFMGMVDENEPEPKSDAVEAAQAEFPSEDTLSSMTLQELRKFAEQEEVDLGSAKTKAEILEVLRAASN